jgi:hypothetical protein
MGEGEMGEKEMGEKEMGESNKHDNSRLGQPLAGRKKGKGREGGLFR